MKTIATILLGLALCAPVCWQTTAGELKDDCKSNIKMLDPDHPKLPYKEVLQAGVCIGYMTGWLEIVPLAS